MHEDVVDYPPSGVEVMEYIALEHEHTRNRSESSACDMRALFTLILSLVIWIPLIIAVLDGADLVDYPFALIGALSFTVLCLVNLVGGLKTDRAARRASKRVNDLRKQYKILQPEPKEENA